MQKESLQSLRNNGLNTDTGLIRLVAVASMIVDHVGAVFFPAVTALRVVGRIAFPLFCYGVVLGSIATRDWRRYALRLLLGGLVSQGPYMLAMGHSLTELNVLFTLLLGLLSIVAVQKKRYGSAVWGPALCLALASAVRMDYGWKGVLFILLLYLARGSRGGVAAAVSAFCLYWGAASSDVSYLFGFSRDMGLGALSGLWNLISSVLRLQALALLSLPFMLAATDSGIRLGKWFHYAVYPGHLLAIYLVSLLL